MRRLGAAVRVSDRLRPIFPPRALVNRRPAKSARITSLDAQTARSARYFATQTKKNHLTPSARLKPALMPARHDRQMVPSFSCAKKKNRSRQDPNIPRQFTPEISAAVSKPPPIAFWARKPKKSQLVLRVARFFFRRGTAL